MTNRSDLRYLCRRRLGDLASPAIYSDLQINQWIIDAIADYTVYFPRELTDDIDLTTGTHAYSLASPIPLVGVIRHILKVEYPYGQNPPEYLEERSERDARGFYGENYYSYQGEPPTNILLGPDVITGEKANITYQADHDYLDGDSDVATVPDRHLELIVLFVRMAAAQETAHGEMMEPNPSNLLSSTLSAHARRCEQEYRGALKSFIQAESPGGQMVSWTMDDNDKIY